MVNFLTLFDNPLALALYEWHTQPAVDFFIGISEFGRTYTIIALTAVALLVFLMRRQFSYATGLLVSVGGAAAAVYVVKELVERPRPELDISAYLEQTFSFPSGHAAFSLALYGFIAWAISARRPRRERIFWFALSALIITLVSFSRLYLGVHYLTDVLGGLVIGAVFLSIGIAITNRVDRFSRSKLS
ncbi:MAG: Phosphoesterase PA-phosphatase related protein [Parcubacteria group bacterium GW2011_GWA2_51_10]|nr:MAG: Phosphoesterase PA-phosphatase related protein [Parcubacteria group bacterium GW2011_GWA2_51_10]